MARGLTKFSKQEIKFLFEKAKKHASCGSFVILRADSLADVGRLLIVSSKKVGNAPKRNLLKRRLKHIFFQKKIYDKGFDWILIARKKATKLTFATLEKKLLHFFALD
ncbi:ribonuclease P protein component [Candidatus Dependentiae bacterium]|nr:MAG: ribonuclease P protein component [Candidatus Dependentiae bacterium]